jgi:hypothetical protein
MTDTTDNVTPAVSNPFSGQPTGLVETTFAETLGLSMHNAVTTQQSSQMTTAASITNACARLLQAPVPVAPAKKEKAPEPAPPPAATEPPPAKKRFNIMNFLKPKKKTDDGTTTQSTEPTISDTQASS